MTSLYKITTETKELLDSLETVDFLTDEERTNLLSSIQGDLKEKCLNVAAYIKHLEAEEHQMMVYMDDMRERRVKKNAKIEKLIEILKWSMQVSKLDKIEGVEFDIKLAKNPPSLLIENIDSVPAFFKHEKVELFIDKNAIKYALKDGKEIAGCRLVEDSMRVVIK